MYLWQGGLDEQTQESGVLDSCHFGSGCHSGFVHSLASSVRWTGRCCLYPRGSRDYKASNKVRERSHCKTSWSWDWNLLVACRCIACLRDYSDTHHGGTDGPIRRELRTLTRTLTVSQVNQGKLGTLSPMLFDAGWWGLGLLHFVYAGHYPASNYGPTYPSPGVPDLNTLVDSLLHQMHLMPLTWFNGAHHRWRKSWSGHSLPASIMLKRSPGSKIYCVPSSTIELLQGFLATWDSLAGRGCLCRGMEQYGFTVIGVASLPPSIRYL